jgi:heme A synthase
MARLAEDHGEGAHFLKRLRVLHPILAVTLSLFLLAVAPRLAGYAGTQRGARAAMLLAVFVFVQLCAGTANVWLSAPGYLQVIHLTLALAVWLAFIALTNEALFEVRALRAALPALRASRPAPESR